jgi:hypothetical protein
VASSELNADFVTLFEEMAEAWVRAPGPEGMHLPEATLEGLANVEAVAVVYGWMARVVRSGEAALILLARDYDEEASPLVRSMLGHAIGLWWLVEQRGDAFQVLVRARANEMRRFEKAQKHGWQFGADEGQELLRQAIEAVTEERTVKLDRFTHVAEQATEFGLGSFLQAWMIESWTSHASIASARAYYEVKANPGSSTDEIALHRIPPQGHRELAAAVTSVMHTAFCAYNKMLEGEPLADRLETWRVRFEELGVRLRGESEAPAAGD